MRPIIASRTNVYTGSPLDRASARRDDPGFIDAALAAPDSLWVPVWRAKNLLTALEPAYLAGPAADAVRTDGVAWAFLGLRGTTSLFAIDLSHHDDPPAGDGQYVDLRQVGPGMSGEDAAVLAHARGLMHWRARHRFCGVCGHPCVPRAAGNAMVCTGCEAQHFPRTDPAVIMLVTRHDRVLLGHSARFPRATMYSTLAGFVEPGESLEEAVRREVLEESGVAVGAVHYHSSQPWPFPASIMLGFYAEGLSDEIVIDQDELRDARWFTRAELADPDAHGFHLPRADSIARRLIEDWRASA